MKKYLSAFLLSSILISSFYTSEAIDTTFNRLGNFVDTIELISVKEQQSFSELIDKSPTVSRKVVLGNEQITNTYSYLIDGKKIGLVTNQTGVNSNGIKTVDVLYNYPNTDLTSIYSPEHGLDGTAKAGAYVDSYTDLRLNLPVYSLYGKTREPSKAMLENVDVILYDMQDIGSRTYTYISTLNYVMRAAAKNNKTVVVLDRPNPLGATIVDGYVAKDKYLTFVGVDNLPIQHGMTVGELALFFNRKINCNLVVVPMKNYTRNMVWQDTGLDFVATSPNIPNIVSAFGYIATGMGEGTTVGQGDKFTWVGTTGINSTTLARTLNSYNLPGVTFTSENKNSRGGVKLTITDYKLFNPTKTCIYILTTINNMKKLSVPAEKNKVIPMFEKIWGGTTFGEALKNNYTAEQVIQSYQQELNAFKSLRQKYLIYS